jgi:DNA-binding MarR family transcriptional regulator
MTKREELYLTATRLNRQLEQLMGDHAQSSLQFEAMAYIRTHRSATVHHLADYLGLSVSSATQLLNRMVRAKLVLRHRDTQDRRTVHLTLSSHGTKVLATVMKQQTACLRTVFSGITDAQLKAAITVQQHILHNLSHLK